MHFHVNQVEDAGKASFRLKLAAAITFAYVVFEIVTGTMSHSLSLYTDATQNFVDGLALLLAWWSIAFAARPPDRLRTFGYHRAKVLIALLNAVILLPVILQIGYHACYRFVSPVPIDGTIVGAAGALGILVNLGVALLLKTDSHQLHIRGAYLHNLADAASSILLVLSGFLIKYTGYSWIDMAVSAVICVLLVASVYPIAMKAIHILLEGAPEDANPQKIEETLLLLPNVAEVHDLHIWMQSDGIAVMSCHIVVKKTTPADQDQVLLDNIRQILRDKFALTHSTIQVEHASCEQSKLCTWGDQHQHQQ